jgi:membrane-associated phospholipid phosphatase
MNSSCAAGDRVNAQLTATTFPTRLGLPIALWVGATLLAALIDAPLASRIYSSGVYETVKYSLLFRFLKAPGNVWGLPVLLVLVWWLSRPSIRPTLLLGLTAALAGIFSSAAKWAVGRHRPIAHGIFNVHPFRPDLFHDGLLGLFAVQHNESFPSGHTCLAFAIAGAFAVMQPRYRIWFFLVAALVGAERLLEDAHYLTDVLAGAGLGILASVVAARGLRFIDGSYSNLLQ